MLKMMFFVPNFKSVALGEAECWRRPSGRAFGCAGTTPMARFRHTASIADAKGGGGHFANAPQRQGFRGAGLSRHHTDRGSGRCFRMRRTDLDRPGDTWPPHERRHWGGGARRTFGSVVRGSCRESARTGPHVHPSRPRPGMAMTARIRVVMVHRPAEPAPFPFSSCEVRGTAAIAVFRRFPEMGAPSAISIGMGLTEDRLRLARLPQRPSPTFFRRLRLCIAKQKSRRRPPSTSFQP